MSANRVCRCLVLLFLLLGAGVGAWAQAPTEEATATPAPAWPHDSSGQVSFRGRLPWPDSVRGDEARQALVRRWFLARLTDMEATRQQYLAQQGGTTFGAVPRTASLRLDTYDREGNEEIYQLIYMLDFLPTPTGLEYQLSDFEVLHADTDTGATLLLENVLATDQIPQTQQALAAFRQRLATALLGW